MSPADLDAEFEAIVARVDEMVGPPDLGELPGPELAARLWSLDASTLADYDVVRALAAWVRVAAWAAAGQLTAAAISSRTAVR